MYVVLCVLVKILPTRLALTAEYSDFKDRFVESDRDYAKLNRKGSQSHVTLHTKRQ